LRSIETLASVVVMQDVAYVGGGSLPDQKMPTWVVEITARNIGDADFAQRLRMGAPAAARKRCGFSKNFSSGERPATSRRPPFLTPTWGSVTRRRHLPG